MFYIKRLISHFLYWIDYTQSTRKGEEKNKKEEFTPFKDIKHPEDLESYEE